MGGWEEIEEIEVMQEIEKAIEEEEKRKDVKTEMEMVGEVEKVEKKVMLNEIEEGELEDKIAFVDPEIDTDEPEEISKKAMEEQITEKKDKENNLDQLPPVTDGIKVILHQSESILEKDHFIYLRHRNVEIYDNGRGKYYYMIGGFQTELDAYKFMQSFIAPDKNYKEPFIAKFMKGIMSVVNH